MGAVKLNGEDFALLDNISWNRTVCGARYESDDVFASGNNVFVPGLIVFNLEQISLIYFAII